MMMHYRFNLPSDYDISIIQRRIQENGPKLDQFPGLDFKAYLWADRDDTELPLSHHLYAPFYFWKTTQGMQRFLAHPGFGQLVDHFGRPQVHSWLPWQCWVHGDIGLARYAQRSECLVRPNTPVDGSQVDDLVHRSIGGVSHTPLVTLVGLDAFEWRLSCWHFWQDKPDDGVALSSEPLGASAALDSRKLNQCESLYTEWFRVGYVARGR